MPQLVAPAIDFAQGTSSWQSGQLLLQRRPDPALQPMVWELSYRRPYGAVADAIRRHWQEWGHRDFDWTPPGATDPVRVEYAEPPSITWDHAVAIDATIRLRQVTAYE